MLKEFKKFALKGNMIDLAVGVIIGGGFNALVTSMVNDIIMPVISLFTGRLDFTNMFIALDGQHYPTLAEAQAHTSTIAYGSFITGLINFLLTAFVIFLVILQQLEGNLIYPKLVGTSIGLPGVWVLAAITVGGGMLGIVGMLLSVPIVATLYRLLQSDIRQRSGKERAKKSDVSPKE